MEYKESKDGILYNKPGFDNVLSVKTKLLSEEAVLTSKNKKATDHIKATKEKDDEIAMKLQELKISTDKKNKESKESNKDSNDKSLMLKGKGGKGQPKGKGGGTKGRNTWNESSQWPTRWSSPEASSTNQYANWQPPAKGKGYVKPKVDPSTLWCDLHQAYGHSTDWCFDNPYRTGGPPITNPRPWCESCHSYGHTSETCYANSPRNPTPKGKGKPLNSKGKGDKGQFGDRKWKSQNFPAAYIPEQATPALHDESPSKDPSQEWWDAKEIGSSCLETTNQDEQNNDFDDEYDDVEIAEEIDVHFLAIIQNIERQKEYLLAPTAEKLQEFKEHDGYITQAISQLNIHSQRIVLSFKAQVGYVGCMTTFIANKALATEIDFEIGTPLEHEPAINTVKALLDLESELKEKLQLEIDTHLNKENDMATARSLLEHNPELQLTMKFEMVIDTQIERDLRADTVQTLLESALGLPLSIHCALKFDRPIQCEPGIKIKALLAREFASQLQMHMKQRASCLSPRDRDFCFDPLLVGGSDPDLAGQASSDRKNDRLAIPDSSNQLRPSYISPRDRDFCSDPPLEGGSNQDLAGQASSA
jgi:hypothetical protein